MKKLFTNYENKTLFYFIIFLIYNKMSRKGRLNSISPYGKNYLISLSHKGHDNYERIVFFFLVKDKKK